MTIQFKLAPDHYQYLPLYAKISIERLGGNHDLRTHSMLDELLDCYAKTYGEQCSDHVRHSAHHIVSKRFGMSYVNT